MKLGLLTVPFSQKPLEEFLPWLKQIGVQAIELGTGGFTNDSHCKLDDMLADPGKIRALRDLVNKYEMEISALSCHGNPLHPVGEIADAAHKCFEDTVVLAEKLGVQTVVTFSGCPGDSDQSNGPNWVICPWPDEFLKILDFQWNEKLIPYWKKAALTARDAGVNIAIEMHPGFSVYNTQTMLRLRNEAGKEIGANFDPSHLFWQGMDAVAAIRELGDAIYYVHAKDCRLDDINISRKGVLDATHYSDEVNRSWLFRTVGCGHGEDVWRDIVANLRMVGYDGVLSIEHEDSLMSIREGIEKSVSLLKQVLIYQPSGDMWWA